MSRKKTCPICGKPKVAEYQPFCSKHCADADLSRWLGGAYRIPTDEIPDGGGWPPDEEEAE